MPQGSSLGPILYLVYVNDIPAPAHPDTLVSRFADDVVHLVISDLPKQGWRSLRDTNLLRKTKTELQRIQSWEQDWKIKSNLAKCEVMIHGAKPGTLRGAGGISVNDQPIPVKDGVKILGYNHTKSKIHAGHISSLVAKANRHLQQLRRFRHVPSKVKLYLYKALVRPLMEYPAVLLADSSRPQINKLQVVQNKALRFAYEVRWQDRITNDALHQRANLAYIQDRLSKLQSSVFRKIRETYLDRELFPPTYKYSDFRIETESFYPQRNEVNLLLERFALLQRLQPPDD